MLGAAAPAAGAPAVQIMIASVLACAVSAVLIALVQGHLSGRSKVLRRAGANAGHALGMASWAGLPIVIATSGLALGALGVFWDIAIHMADGRDEGPLVNPSHYLILAALYSCFAAGVLSIALYQRTSTPARRPLRLPGGIEAPVGGVLLLGCGAFALSGFPLDDVWHRMFGQDVTLWGPTHLVMINGAILSVPSIAVLGLEARRSTSSRPSGRRRLGRTLIDLSLPAALLFSVSFWSTEFDWGLPQYRLVWHPLLLAAAAGLALVSARTALGRGGALLTVALFLVLRALTHLGVDLLGETAPAMPLFVAEAILVELAFLLRASVLTRGLLAGVLCGSVGFAAEYAWSHVVMPLPWTTALLAEGIPTALAAGTAGAALGVLLGGALRGRLLPRPARRIVAGVAAAVLVAAGVNALWTKAPDDLRAAVTLEPAAGGEAMVVARFERPAVARDAGWLTVTAWQGGGVVLRHMREVAPGTWRSDGPVPLGGAWKTSLRLQAGRTLAALPLHLPADPAVPFAGVRRPARFEAAFVPDVEVMQTERRDFVPGWLWTPAALMMLAFCALFSIAIAAGIARASEAGPAAAPPPRSHRRPARRRRTLAGQSA